MSVSTKDLRKTLGKKELFSVAVGQVIGAGIMTLTGIAIGLTGRSVNIAFIIAALFVILLFTPVVFISSAVRMRGGQYTQAAVFINQQFAGFFIIIFIFANISIAMYAISFAQYFIALIPGVNYKLIAGILVTFIFVTNYFGMGKATKLQGIMVIILVIALISFGAYGITEIKPGYFSQPGFLTNGLLGLFQAVALLIFATGGANNILNLSGEAKNPKRDIPIVIIFTTILVAILYALIATVAAGVLPIAEVAHEPLTDVAMTIFPGWLYIFFIVGGAMFALVSTLNSQVGWVTKPIMQACVDNWFPKKLATLHPKYNTPKYILLIFYLIGIIPIIIGIDIDQIANSSLFLNYIIYALMSFGALRLPKLYPDLWAKSPYKVPNLVLKLLIVISVLVAILQIVMTVMTMDKTTLIGGILILSLATSVAIFRNKYVRMEISVEKS